MSCSFICIYLQIFPQYFTYFASVVVFWNALILQSLGSLQPFFCKRKSLQIQHPSRANPAASSHCCSSAVDIADCSCSPDKKLEVFFWQSSFCFQLILWITEECFSSAGEARGRRDSGHMHLLPCEPSSNGYLIQSTNGLSKPFKLVITERIDCETAVGGGPR